MANTPNQELVHVWQTIVVPAYPSQETMINALNVTTWVATATGDPIADFFADQFVLLRNSAVYGWNIEMNTAQKLSLYDQIDAIVTLAKTEVDAVQAVIHTAYEALVTP